MSGDYRFFIKVHNGFPEHRKTMSLSDRAFRRLVEVWCLCSRNLNDGKLTDVQVSQLFSRKVRDELVAVGYLEQTDSGWEMHDYLAHQMSASQVADLREKRVAAGRRGGQAKANHLASVTADAKQTPSKPVADIDIDKDDDTKTTTELPSSAEPMARSGYPPAFIEFWKIYPRKVGKDKALGAWKSAVKRSDQQTVLTGVHRMLSDPNLPDEQFIPHPTTWLNRGGWNDAPFPGRNGQSRESTTNARVNEAAAAGRRLMAALGQRPINGQNPLEITA
jgi:hypothetical protein